MKALIICHSHHHLNTQKIAGVIANVLGAEVKTPEAVAAGDISSYDLVGFGSGIYFGKHHKSILSLVDKMPNLPNKSVFIFSTSGEEDKAEQLHKKLREKLKSKGCQILNEYTCPGYDTYLFTKIVGGIQKGRPNDEDLKQAQTFAEDLKRTYNVLLLCDKPAAAK